MKTSPAKITDAIHPIKNAGVPSKAWPPCLFGCWPPTIALMWTMPASPAIISALLIHLSILNFAFVFAPPIWVDSSPSSEPAESSKSPDLFGISFPMLIAIRSALVKGGGSSVQATQCLAEIYQAAHCTINQYAVKWNVLDNVCFNFACSRFNVTLVWLHLHLHFVLFIFDFSFYYYYIKPLMIWSCAIFLYCHWALTAEEDSNEIG